MASRPPTPPCVPAVALGKCAFDLAAVDARDDGVADVVNRFDVTKLVFAGERVEFDFEHADAVGIIGERLAAAVVDVVVDVGRCVVTGGRELDAVGVGPVDDLDDIDGVFARCETQAVVVSRHPPTSANYKLAKQTDSYSSKGRSSWFIGECLGY